MGRGIHIPSGGLLGCSRGAGRHHWRRLHHGRLSDAFRRVLPYWAASCLAGLAGLPARRLEGIEAFPDGLFVATIGGVVVGPVFDGVRQVLLLDLGLVVVVRVAIALAVADLSHERRWGIPQMKRNRVGAGALDVLLHSRVGGV